MRERCCPAQCRRTESLLDLVGHGVKASLLLSVFLIEQKSLPKSRFIETADSHAHEPHRKMVSGKAMAEHLVGGLPEFVGDVRGLG